MTKDVIGPVHQSRTIPGDPIDAQAIGKELGHEKVMLQLAELAKSLSEVEGESFWRTLVIDRDITEFDTKNPGPKEFGVIQRAIFGQEPTPECFMPDHPNAIRVVSFSMNFTKNMDRTLMNRCFFTSSGHMGIRPYLFYAAERYSSHTLWRRSLLYFTSSWRSIPTHRGWICLPGYEWGAAQGQKRI